MNIELLESFGQNFPEESDGQLDCTGMAVCCKFNRWGSLLAVGCNDGRVVIFDFVTRGIAKILASAHVMPVCCLSWSRSGRKLVSASTDNTAAVWEVLTGDCSHRFRFPCPIMKVQFHPRDENKFLVCPLRMGTILINMEDGSHLAVPVEDEQGQDLNITATFDRRGEYILTGNGRGKIGAFRSNTMVCDACFRLPSSHAIRNLEAGRKGEFILTNSSDRVIRVFHLREILLRGKNTGPIEALQKLQDMVNKTAWKTCCLSGDSEYVCAGSAKAHSLYIWEKNSGSLVKILTGTKGEQLMDAQWHPARPLICSVSNGLVSIWSQSHVENWSAFAPDFKELDENVEYEERESEFDLEDEDRSVELNREKPTEDEEVDVVSVTPAAVFCSSDEEDDGLDLEVASSSGSPVRQKTSTSVKGHRVEPVWFLPTAPEIEQPEENPYAVLISESSSSGSQINLSGAENRPPEGIMGSVRKQKPREFSVELRNAPTDELHPLLLGTGPGRKRQQEPGPRAGQVGRPPSKQRRMTK